LFNILEFLDFGTNLKILENENACWYTIFVFVKLLYLQLAT